MPKLLVRRQTFLEYLLTNYLSTPIRTGQHGESYWYCPQCEHHRFHTFPDVPDEKHRAKCWKCGLRGDDMDMLRQLLHPDVPDADVPWRELFTRRDDLKYEWQQQRRP